MAKTTEQNRAAKTRYKERHPDKYKESYLRYSRKVRAEKPTHRMDLQRKRLYNQTPEDYQKLHEEQNGVCAICHQPELAINPKTGRPFALATDHNHKTGQVRGLLCSKCNPGLGNFKDSPELLDNAAAYLRKWNGNEIGNL